MPIYSLEDLRSAASRAGVSGSDEFLITDYAKRVGKDPMEVADYLGYRQGQGMGSSRISAGVDNYQAGLLGVGEVVAGKLGLGGVSSAMRSRREVNEFDANVATRRAREQGAIDSYKDIGGVGDFFNYAGGLAAQSLPYMGEAIVGGLVGGATLPSTAARMGLGVSRAAGATAGGVVASYPSAVGDILRNQREENGTTDLGSAALGGVPYAALNAFGVEGMLSRGLRGLGTEASESLMRRMGTGALKVSGAEGVSETGQEMINQGFGRMAVNPNQTMFNPDANERYMESFVGGATLGAFGGAVGGIKRKTVEEQPDLLNRAVGDDLSQVEQPMQQLGFSGYDTGVGQIIAFPDGSSMLRSEWEQLVREGRTPDLEAKYPGFLRGYDQSAGPMFEPGSLTMDGQLVPSLAAEREQMLADLAALPEDDTAGRESLLSGIAYVESLMRGDNPVQMIPGQQDLFFPNGEPTYGADGGVAPGRPDVFQADRFGNVAATQENLDQMNDPGAVLARQVWAERNQAKQPQATPKVAPAPVADENADLDAMIKERTGLKATDKRRAAAKAIVGSALEGQQEVDAWNALAVNKYGQVEKIINEANAQPSVQPATNAGGIVATQPQTTASGARRVRAEKPAGTTVAPVANTTQPGAVTTRKEALETAETTVQDGVKVTKFARVEPKVEQAPIERPQDVSFRRGFLSKFAELPTEDRDLLGKWLGLRLTSTGEIGSGETSSLRTLGVEYGVSHEGVRQRIQAALTRAGAPADINQEIFSARLGAQASGTTSADLTRNTDTATKAEEAPLEGDVVVRTRAEDKASEQTAEQETELAGEPPVEAGNDGDVVAEVEEASDESVEDAVDRARQEPVGAESGGSVRQILAKAIVNGLVLDSDIAATKAAFEDAVGRRGYFDTLAPNHQARLVYAYAEQQNTANPNRAKDENAKVNTASASTSVAETTRQGARRTGRTEAAVPGVRPQDAGVESEVGQTGPSPQASAPTVVTKKKKRIVRPDSDTPFSNPRFSKSVKPKSDAVRAQEARVDKYKQLLACLTA